MIVAEFVLPSLPNGAAHGWYAYQRLGCRCVVCTDANTKSQAKYRERVAGTLAPDDPRHGTLNAYNTYRCRCPACTQVKREVNAAHQARLRAERRAS